MDSPETQTQPSADELRQKILHFLQKHPDSAHRSGDIAKGLGIEDNDTYLRFCDVIAELSAQRLVQQKGRKYKHKAQTTHRTGVLECNEQGFGFVQAVDTDEEFFIREPHMGEALHGDLVRVAVAAKAAHDKKRECEVVEIVERRRTQVVGTFHDRGNFAFVEPDDRRILQEVYVSSDDFGGAEDGEKVVVSIDRFDSRKASPEGRILRVIGPADDPNVRVLSLAMSMDVKSDFPKAVEEEANEIPVEIPQSEIDRRLDLRDKNTFTIDPEDAKDFDDAIHIERLDNDNFAIGVHIADVSHYVQPDTAINEEALDRATSVYLVDRTIPMLPEKLSNKVCSLRPHEDKLAYSVLMEVTPHGEVVDYDIRETVIHSKQRLTYDRAQDYIDGGYPEDPVSSEVVQANRLAKTLTKKRLREGAIDFGSDEVQVILDDDGHPQDIVRKERLDANRLIEELMLLANRTVASHIGAPGHNERVRTNGQSGDRDDPLPFVYRVHDTPDGEKIRQLAEYVRVFGHELPLTDGNATNDDLGDLVDAIKGQPEEQVIVRAALRAMSKAKYAVGNIGHYGLGFDYYSHFTSPIRRYPDLMVHRLLKRYAKGEAPPSVEDLASYCEHCSEQERNAEEAERESVKLKQVEYVQEHVGDVFEGVVSGVTKFGVFVELTELLVEGLVHVRDMDDDYYVYDESTYTMRGENQGKSYRPGDSVTVEVVGADIDSREIDLLFVEDD
ncbi:ribonuclease R [Salinibacter sp. 10B]|uniref:ribonuclease R n=1 Tax=Salinibacter sp. 10B TaxID=1923971 RepID=UPI00215782EB|nr:ribonuclease R [Salinibacter sp. 10B]